MPRKFILLILYLRSIADCFATGTIKIMPLTQEESMLIKNLQSQEKLCIDKYAYYASQAKDQELKDLFHKIEQQEQQHYDSLGDVLNGKVPAVNSKDSAAASYAPKTTYNSTNCSPDKEHDQLLCTDCIATEKYVSSAYDNDLFHFASTDVRKLLNDIQTEEQNHGEMIYKYKTANGMA